MGKYCKKCGAEIKPNTKFCPSCGELIEEKNSIGIVPINPAEKSAKPTAEHNLEDSTKSKKLRKIRKMKKRQKINQYSEALKNADSAAKNANSFSGTVKLSVARRAIVAIAVVVAVAVPTVIVVDKKINERNTTISNSDMDSLSNATNQNAYAPGQVSDAPAGEESGQNSNADNQKADAAILYFKDGELYANMTSDFTSYKLTEKMIGYERTSDTESHDDQSGIHDSEGKLSRLIKYDRKNNRIIFPDKVNSYTNGFNSDGVQLYYAELNKLTANYQPMKVSDEIKFDNEKPAYKNADGSYVSYSIKYDDPTYSEELICGDLYKYTKKDGKIINSEKINDLVICFNQTDSGDVLNIRLSDKTNVEYGFIDGSIVVGDLYLNNKKIDSNVVTCYGNYIPIHCKGDYLAPRQLFDGSICYYSNYNMQNETATIKLYNGEKTVVIAENAFCVCPVSKDKVYYIANYDASMQTGDLYVKTGDTVIEIAFGVKYAVTISSMEYIV